MITGRVVKLFSGPLTADARSDWLDCTNAIYITFRVLVRNYTGLTNIVARVDGAFEDPKAVALANDDIMQTTSVGTFTGNGVSEVSFTNARSASTVIITPHMSINLDVTGAGSADVIVYALIQEDVG